MKCGLLWVTYGKDLPWFEISARSYAKFARGFDWAKCVVPNPDVESFKPSCEAAGIQLCGFDEWPEKGQLHHQFMKCYGDCHFPDADYVFHIDADCVFAQECNSSDWIFDGKAFLTFQDFSNFLKKPLYAGEEVDFMGCHGLKVDFSRGQYFWKFAADVALGWSVVRECMQSMPIVHCREVYQKTRAAVTAQHGNFEAYVRNGRNQFPQTFAEFPTLGAVAHRDLETRYLWWDVSAHPNPLWGKVLQSHSHSGFDLPHDYGIGRGKESPRQLFTRLGLL